MANTSIKNAFERMWQHIVAALGNKADAEHKHSATDITSGILPIERGGTGNSSGYIRTGQKSGTTIGNCATAEGSSNTASGSCSHAEGAGTTASSEQSHAEGNSTTASGLWSHAEGFATYATGMYSHAEGGKGTTASGSGSHAEGECTIAAGSAQHVQGKYNLSNTSTYAHIVGNGYFDSTGNGTEHRSNAHTIDWDGNANFAGDVYVGNANENKAGKKLATEEHVNNAVNAIDFPVDSVNGKTGAVILSASDVGARPNTWLPTLAEIGAAASSHNHSAANITSGTLGVARGGTGKATHTSNAVLTGNGTSAVNNVATASGALYATAANGAAKFGTLPIAQGGTGATSAANALKNLGAAPSGYGLGASGELREFTKFEDLNTLTKNGWYFARFASPITIDSYSVQFMTVEVCGETAQHVHQILHLIGSNYKVHRYSDNGSWHSHEWENPPMVLGTEYRTTERYNGKPVYAKLVNYGTMPNNTQKSINVPTKGTTMITYAEGIARHSGNITHVPLGGHLAVAIVTEIFSSNIALTLQASTDFSAWSAIVLLKYIKN